MVDLMKGFSPMETMVLLLLGLLVMLLIPGLTFFALALRRRQQTNMPINQAPASRPIEPGKVFSDRWQDLYTYLQQTGHRPKQVNSVRLSPIPFFWQGFFVIFAIACVVAIFYSYVKPLQNYLQLQREGIPVQAIVTRLESSEEPESYRVFYQYRIKVNDQLITLEEHDSVSRMLYKSLEVGKPINILYASSAPSVSAIQSEMSPPPILSLIGLVGIAILFSWLLMTPVQQEMELNRQGRALKEKGQKAQAIVFDQWTETDNEGSTLYLTAIAFKTNSQIMAFADQDSTFYNKHKIGDVVTVRYLPEKPTVYEIL
jgi:hypothetical protein